MHEVLVNRLGGLSLPRKSVVRLTDRPDMTLDVYRGRKTTMQQQQYFRKYHNMHFAYGISFFSTVFQLNHDNGRLIMKRCVHLNLFENIIVSNENRTRDR